MFNFSVLLAPNLLGGFATTASWEENTMFRTTTGNSLHDADWLEELEGALGTDANTRTRITSELRAAEEGLQAAHQALLENRTESNRQRLMTARTRHTTAKRSMEALLARQAAERNVRE